MVKILITLVISESILIFLKLLVEKLHFKMYLEKKYNKKIRFRDIK